MRFLRRLGPARLDIEVETRIPGGVAVPIEGALVEGDASTSAWSESGERPASEVDLGQELQEATQFQAGCIAARMQRGLRRGLL